MASKFQNRLLGTVVLVAVVVIVLPAILDGHKKHYQDDFAAIPLVAKPGDQHDLALPPPASQPLSVEPPAGAAQEIQAANASGPSLETLRQAIGQSETPPPPGTSPPQTAPQKPAPPADADEEPDPIMALLNQQRESARPPPAASQSAAPQAQAYIVQLGALRNADKVNEIITQLRAAGYRAYTLPATPVAGQLTRILVGPEINKDKLTRALPELQRLSGLSGVIKNYQVRE